MSALAQAATVIGLLLWTQIEQIECQATAETPTTTAAPVYDVDYPPSAADEATARNTTLYSHGYRYQFTIHIEANDPTSNGLPKTLYRRAVFYPAVDQLARLLVKGSVEQIGSQYNNVTVYFEVGDGVFGGYPGAPDRRVWKQGNLWNRYWEFLIFADCLTQEAAMSESGDLKCGTIIAAGVSDDGCGVGCLDISCLDPAPLPITTTTVVGQTAAETTTTTTATAAITNSLGGRPGRRCFSEQSRDLAVFVGWAGTSNAKVAFTSRKDMPSTYQLYAFGDLGSAVTDEFTLFG